MVMKTTSIFMLFAFLFISTAGAFAEHAPGERHTFRTLLTIGGAVGGAVAGAAIGEQSGSGWDFGRNAAVGGVIGFSCGLVGGYFVGRKIDKGRIPKATPDVDPQKVKAAQSRAMDQMIKEYSARLSRHFPAQPAGE
jgi:uncharacterized protein YcfJ